MKTLYDLCSEYGIPIRREGNHWVGPCIWSFDEEHSLTIDPNSDRWEDFITGFSGDMIDFVMAVEARLEHLGRVHFAPADWSAEKATCAF